MINLSDEVVNKIARELNLEPCLVKAVTVTEANSNPFLPDGRPVILFEPHIFNRELKKLGYDTNQLRAQHPNILTSSFAETKTKKLHKSGVRAWAQMDEAILIDQEAALKSASYGAFQIMGFNYAVCKFATVYDFVHAMEEGIEGQAQAFVNFLESNNLTRHLRSHNWAAFAKGYNGASYATQKYDKVLERNYTSCIKAGKLK